MSGWAIGLEFDEVGAAVPDWLDDGNAVVFGPVVRAGEGMEEAGGVGLPGAEIEVEGVLIGVGGDGLEGGWGFFFGEVCDEGPRPGFAAIVGVGLFVAMGVGGADGPFAADENGFVVEGVGGVEVAAAVCELADHWRVERGRFAVDEALAPLMGLRVVEEEAHAFPASGWAVGFDFFELCAAVPDLADADCAVELDCFGGVGEGLRGADDVGVPDAYVEVEVVLAVARQG